MDRYAVLARVAPGNTDWNDLYTCPVAEATTYDSGNIEVKPQAADQPQSTVVSSISVCRLAATGGGALYFSLAVVDAAGDTVTNPDYLVYQQDISGGETKIFSFGMTLSAGQTLRVQVETLSTIAFVVNGVEVY